MDKEQIIALAEKAKLFVVRNGDCDVEDLRRFLEAYKAELLNEACEPVAKVEQHARMTSQSTTLDRALRAGTTLYTSDQVAAAIIKATGPLEEEVERLKKHQCAPVCIFHEGDEREELKAQLAAAQEEIKTITEQKNRMWFEMQTAQNQLAKAEQLWQVAQGRCDGLEEKLAKAEQRVAEWQPIETAPKDGVWILCKSFRRLTTEQSREISWNGKCWATRDCSRLSDPTHWMPLPKAPTGASS